MIRKYKLHILFFIPVLVLSLLLSGCEYKKEQEPAWTKIPDPKTLNESYVSNPDKILSEETVTWLNAKLRPLDQAGTAHIDVVFVNSIGEAIPKDIAHELFNTWKIGSKETNNGLLILMVKDQRRIEFETGYGLEGILPDMICQRIQQEHMVPQAKENNYDAAVTAGVTAVINRLTGTETPAPLEAVLPDTIPAETVPTDTKPAMTEGIREMPVDITPAPPSSTEPRSHFADVSYPSPKGPIGSLFTLVILFFYFKIAKAIGNRVKLYSGDPPFLNPTVLIIFGVPVAIIILLNLYFPIDWISIRAIVILYVFIALYIHLHFYLKTRKLKVDGEGKSNHEQFLAWRDSYEPLRWATKVIPGLSSYWQKYTLQQEQLRNAPVNCEKCGKTMVLLDEDEDNKHLQKGQVAEEKIDAVDYDVWQCNSCKHSQTLDYQNLKSTATICPKCNYRTLQFTRSRIIEQATTSSSGKGCSDYTCYHCKFVERIEYKIARISTGSSGGSSSSGSSRSSSSSSSSSSSGGSSGGGGSGSSW
ncbi:MAG: TPM domain-containing protein [Pedobacter sp.]|uniref:TPM domain-containing protein n=1 Tax=Pedobacter sp. TaxID=1411316 RepID=UPI003569C31E